MAAAAPQWDRARVLRRESIPHAPTRRRCGLPATAATTPSLLGLLTVRRIAPGDASAASVLLARSFIGKAALADAADFVAGAAAAGGGGGDSPLLLVADLVPDGGWGRSGEGAGGGWRALRTPTLLPPDPALLPPSKQSRLAGVIAIATTPAAVAAAAPPPPAPPPGAPLLFSLAVDPACRRAGVGSALLAAAEVEAVAAGAGELWLAADEQGGGVELYASRGYSPAPPPPSRLPGWLASLGGGGAGSVLMRKALQP